MTERDLFIAALQHGDESRRLAFLREACGEDADLRRRVEGLLLAFRGADGFLESPPLATASSEETSVSAEGVGAEVGPYRLIEEIGAGGMGIVYVAEQRQPVRRKVALKVVKPGMDTRQVVARFQAERQALALMDHPNIASVLDAGATDSGRPYFVMELVRGLPITEFCDRETLSIRDRLELFVLVCRAVQHAHQKGVIHRDIKPSNVLVTLHDGVPVPKVIDFGVAKATGPALLTDLTLNTGFHQIIGTPLYMSPEQVEMSGLDVDTRSDVYSLGVLLYELMTGVTPFDPEVLKRAAFDEMRRIIREDEPPRPSARISTLGDTLTTISDRRGADPRRLGAAIRGELDWVAMKALEKDRRRRYQSADELAADVLRHLADRPVEACPPSARYRFAKFARRNRALLTTAAVIGLTLAGAAAVSAWQAVRATRAEHDAEAALDEARVAVDDMYTQVAERWIADQPSLTKLQREFLEKSLAFYRRFAAARATDPETAHAAVRALMRAGNIRSKLGRLDEADESWREVVDRAGELVRSHPNRPEFLLLLAEARIKRADRAIKAGEDARRRKGSVSGLGDGNLERGPIYRESEPSEVERDLLEAGRDLAAVKAASLAATEDRRRLGEALVDLCSNLTLVHRLTEAESAGRSALEVWGKLVADPTAEDADHLGLARAHAGLGTRHLWWGGEDEQAEQEFRRADAMLSKQLESHPRGYRSRVRLGGVLTNLGVVLMRTNRFEEEEVVERRNLALCEGVAVDFPEVPEHRDSLAIALSNLAATIRERHGLEALADEVASLEERAATISEALAKALPDVADYQVRAIENMNRFAQLLRLRGRFDEARELLDRSLALARAFKDRSPGLVAAESSIGNTWAHRIELLVDVGDRDEAAREADEWARQLLHSFSEEERRPEELRWIVMRMVEEMIAALSRPEVEKGTPTGRIAAGTEGVRLRGRALIREAVAMGPDDSGLLYVMADVLSTSPNDLRDPRLALELAEKAVAKSPEDAMCRQSLGWARLRAGDPKGCLETLGEHRSDHVSDPIVAMARFRLGDEAGARATLAGLDPWLTGYETRCEEGLKRGKGYPHPPPAMLRRLRDEAAALLGVTPSAENPPPTTPNPPAPPRG